VYGVCVFCLRASDGLEACGWSLLRVEFAVELVVVGDGQTDEGDDAEGEHSPGALGVGAEGGGAHTAQGGEDGDGEHDRLKVGHAALSNAVAGMGDHGVGDYTHKEDSTKDHAGTTVAHVGGLDEGEGAVIDVIATTEDGVAGSVEPPVSGSSVLGQAVLEIWVEGFVSFIVGVIDTVLKIQGLGYIGGIEAEGGALAPKNRRRDRVDSDCLRFRGMLRSR
jgi:hypothetical protein